MLPFVMNTTEKSSAAKLPLFFYNTLTRKKEIFEPVHNDYVRMYNCGPTVYDYAHIGNLRSYVFSDIIRRVLLINGYKVMQVVNVTDVGHLTSDADEGEDKMTLALKREGKPLTLEAMKEVADTFTEAFLEDLTALNIKHPSALPRASEHVDADIALIETLMQKEYAYQTSDGVYYDTTRFDGYGKLGGIDTEALKEGARVEMNAEKRHHTDFALWKRNDTIGWESPWGRGFPGWHIECSAMAMEYLGKEIDIHTGGIDHIGTHHNNEIAQSEAATGKQFARYWMHHAHIMVEGTKFSKSLQNTIKLRQLVDHGFAPLAYRYWLLAGHYRTQMNFSFHALEGAQTALRRLHRFFVEHLSQVAGGTVNASYNEPFLRVMNDDLDTPKALALVWDLVKDEEVQPADKRATLLHFDRVLGIGIIELARSGSKGIQLDVDSQDITELPESIRMLVEDREAARTEKDWARADTLRNDLEKHGYAVEDTEDGPRITRIRD